MNEVAHQFRSSRLVGTWGEKTDPTWCGDAASFSKMRGEVLGEMVLMMEVDGGWMFVEKQVDV